MRRLRNSPLPTIALLIAVGGCGFSACRRKMPTGETIEDQNFAPTSALEMSDSRHSFQLLRGFHQVEGGSWRWTSSHFAVALLPPANAAKAGAVIEVQLTVPDRLIETVCSITLSATVAGRPLPSKKLNARGDHVYESDVPSECFHPVPRTGLLEVDFVLDRFAGAGVLDERELGIVLRSAALKAK